MAKEKSGKGTKPRRQRSDSATAAVEVMRAQAEVEIVPPANIALDDADMPFWDSIIAAFPTIEWNDHDLEVAAILARTMADLNREQLALRDEGSIVKTDKGTPVVNPRKTVVQMHTGSILSLRRSLQLHARATKGEARDTGKRRGQQQGHEADNPLNGDDLLGPAPDGAPPGATVQ